MVYCHCVLLLMKQEHGFTMVKIDETVTNMR